MTKEIAKKAKKIGTIVSDKMDKTRTVAIIEKRSHPLYQKTFIVTKKILAHDEKNEYKSGEEVEIQEAKPFSKNKSWEIVRKITGKEKNENSSANDSRHGVKRHD